MAEDKLSQFIDEIIDAKKLSGLSEDVHLQLHNDLSQRLEDQINAALINAMPAEKVDELNQLLDRDGISDEDVTQFIQTSGVDTVNVAAQAMVRFRELYLGDNK